MTKEGVATLPAMKFKFFCWNEVDISCNQTLEIRKFSGQMSPVSKVNVFGIMYFCEKYHIHRHLRNQSVGCIAADHFTCNYTYVSITLVSIQYMKEFFKKFKNQLAVLKKTHDVGGRILEVS